MGLAGTVVVKAEIMPVNIVLKVIKDWYCVFFIDFPFCLLTLFYVSFCKEVLKRDVEDLHDTVYVAEIQE